MAAVIPGNGKTDIGKVASPWTNGYFTDLYRGGQSVVTTDDARIPTSDENAALAGTAGAASASNKYVTAADRTRKWLLEGVTGLVGGAATDLDAQTTSGVTVGLVVEIIHANGGSPLARTYELVTGTDATSSPLIIRPVDYNGATNAKVWKLRTTATDGDALAMAYNGVHYAEAAATLAGHLEGIDDQIAVPASPVNYTPADATVAGHLDGIDDQIILPGSVANYTPAAATLGGHLAGIDDALATVLTTRTGVRRTLRIDCALFRANTATPTLGAVDFGTYIAWVAHLPNASTSSVIAAFMLPETWDTAVAPKFKLHWSSLSGTGDAEFTVKGRLFDTAASLTAAFGSDHTFVDASAGTDTLRISAAFAPTLAGSGRLCALDIQRNGSAAGDTLAAGLYLHGIEVQYKELATEPAAW